MPETQSYYDDEIGLAEAGISIVNGPAETARLDQYALGLVRSNAAQLGVIINQEQPSDSDRISVAEKMADCNANPWEIMEVLTGGKVEITEKDCTFIVAAYVNGQIDRQEFFRWFTQDAQMAE